MYSGAWAYTERRRLKVTIESPPRPPGIGNTGFNNICHHRGQYLSHPSLDNGISAGFLLPNPPRASLASVLMVSEPYAFNAFYSCIKFVSLSQCQAPASPMLQNPISINPAGHDSSGIGYLSLQEFDKQKALSAGDAALLMNSIQPVPSAETATLHGSPFCCAVGAGMASISLIDP